MTQQPCRRRGIFAQRNRQSVADPSVTAGSGPAVATPPVSRAEEDASGQIWRPYPPSKDDLKSIPSGAELECRLNTETDEVTYRVPQGWTPPVIEEAAFAAPMIEVPEKRQTLRLKRGRR